MTILAAVSKYFHTSAMNVDLFIWLKLLNSQCYKNNFERVVEVSNVSRIDSIVV